MDLSIGYIFSQVFVVVYYVLLIFTYQTKSRKKILVLNTVALIVNGFSYYLLRAYSGLAMMGLGIVRNVMFFYSEKQKDDTINKKDIIELTILIGLSLILSYFTYDGLLSLMAVVATMTYTLSIWQKNTKVYKFLGLVVGVAGITYNIYIKSILGIVFESLLWLSALVGVIREKVRSEEFQKSY